MANKKEPLTELAQFLGERYASESQRVIENNVRLSTKPAAILCMFDAYYVEFSQNQRELIHLVDVALTEKADADHLKQVKRVSKNKRNRINNQDARFNKFFKEFSSEFTKYFGDDTGEMSSTLLDAFDTFWTNVVTIDKKSVGVKKEFLNNNQ